MLMALWAERLELITVRRCGFASFVSIERQRSASRRRKQFTRCCSSGLFESLRMKKWWATPVAQNMVLGQAPQTQDTGAFVSFFITLLIAKFLCIVGSLNWNVGSHCSFDHGCRCAPVHFQRKTWKRNQKSASHGASLSLFASWEDALFGFFCFGLHFSFWQNTASNRHKNVQASLTVKIPDALIYLCGDCFSVVLKLLLPFLEMAIWLASCWLAVWHITTTIIIIQICDNFQSWFVYSTYLLHFGLF